MSYDDESDVPPYVREMPWLIRKALADAQIAPASWAKDYTGTTPSAWVNLQRVREWGWIAPGGLAPTYAMGIIERAQRAGYLQVFPGGESWSYAGREQYYAGREAALGVSPSVFWSGYYQGRYGEEQPSWIRETQQRYEVSQAYWKFQQAFTPAAEAWGAARIGLYMGPQLGLPPEAGYVRAFGFPFYEAAQRYLAAEAVAPYAQGMTLEQFQRTSPGWITQPPSWGELGYGGIAQWTIGQNVVWGLAAGLESRGLGQGFMGEWGRGYGFLGSIRETLGINIMQPGIQAMVEPLSYYATLRRLGYEEEAQRYIRSPEAVGMMGFGAITTIAGYGVHRYTQGLPLYQAYESQWIDPRTGDWTGRMRDPITGRFVEAPTYPTLTTGLVGLGGAIAGGLIAGIGMQYARPSLEQLGMTPLQIGALETASYIAGPLLGRYGALKGWEALTTAIDRPEWFAGASGAGSTLAGILGGISWSFMLAAGIDVVAEKLWPGIVEYAARAQWPMGMGERAEQQTAAANQQIAQYNLAVQGIGAAFGTQMGALGARSQAAYAALGQAWDVQGDLYAGYQSAWNAYRAKTIDYSTVAFMGGLVGGAVTRALGVSAAMPNLGPEYQRVYSETARKLRQAGASEELVSQFEIEAHFAGITRGGGTWTSYTIPSTQRGVMMEEGYVPLRDYWTSYQVSRYGPARPTFLQMEEGLVDISQPLGAGALAAIYGGLRERGWTDIGGMARRLEMAGILTQEQASAMLGKAFVQELEGTGREWSPSALINRMGGGLTGVWLAAAGSDIAAAALKLALTGEYTVPAGYSQEDVRRLRDYWEDTGQLPLGVREPQQAEEGGFGWQPTPSTSEYYRSDELSGQHGLDLIVTGRTRIIVGESGTEHVKVTPLTSGRGDSELRDIIRRIVADERLMSGTHGIGNMDELEYELSARISKRLMRSMTAKGV